MGHRAAQSGVNTQLDLLGDARLGVHQSHHLPDRSVCYETSHRVRLTRHGTKACFDCSRRVHKNSFVAQGVVISVCIYLNQLAFLRAVIISVGLQISFECYSFTCWSQVVSYCHACLLGEECLCIFDGVKHQTALSMQFEPFFTMSVC